MENPEGDSEARWLLVSLGYLLCLLTFLVAACSEETEQVEEQVDEVQVEAQCAESGDFTSIGSAVHHNHLFDFLSVPCCKADKDAYAHEADNPVHCAACQEDIDDNADEQANQCHVEERTETCKAVFSEIAVDGHCSEHTCRDEECLSY